MDDTVGGEKVTTEAPTIVNIRQNPFERTPSLHGESMNSSAFGYGNEFLSREFWRFVMVQQLIVKLAETGIEYPPMQAGASFNLETVKQEIEAKMKQHQGD